MANATTVHASCNTAFSSAQLRRQVAPFDEPRSNPKPIKSLSVNELRRPGRIVRGLVIFRHEFLSGSFLRFRVPTRQTGSHENVEGLASRRFLFWAFPAGVSTISPRQRQLSNLRDARPAAAVTQMILSAPRFLAPKLSNSRVSKSL